MKEGIKGAHFDIAFGDSIAPRMGFGMVFKYCCLTRQWIGYIQRKGSFEPTTAEIASAPPGRADTRV